MTRSEDRLRSRSELLESLKQPVRHGRRRWLLQHSLTSLAIALACASAASALLVGLSILEVLPFDAVAVSSLIAAIFLLAALSSLAFSWCSTPGEAEMVRLIDDAGRLKSRLVTARELELDPPQDESSRVIHAALLAELGRVAPVVRVDGLLPLRFLPLHAVAIAVALGSIGAAKMVDVWNQDRGSKQVEAPADIDWSAQDLSALSAELTGLASALEEEARQTGDAYTRAVAEQARALATELTQPGGSGAVGRNEISSLLSHVERALGRRFSSDASRRPETVAEGIKPTGRTPADDGKIPLLGLPVPNSPATMDSLVTDVQALREQLEMAQSQRVQNPYGDNFQAESARADGNIDEAGLLGDVRSDAAGAPAGAAERSTDAAGDAAGAGSQDLVGGQRANAAVFGQGDEVALPQAERQGGNRVQASAEVGNEADGDASVIGRRAAESHGDLSHSRVVPRDSIRRDAGDWRNEALSPHALHLAQRLFDPSEAESEE